MKVSVVIPFYNRAASLGVSLESAFRAAMAVERAAQVYRDRHLSQAAL